MARRAAGVQADLRDARLRLLADDLVAAARRPRPGRRRRDRRPGAAGRWSSATSRVASRRESELESALAASAPLLADRLRTPGTGCRPWASGSAASPSWPPSGTGTCPPPRRPRRPGRDPDQLDAEADRVAATEAELAAGLEAERARLAAVVAERAELETALGRGRAGVGRRRPRAGRPPGGAGPAVRRGRRRPVAGHRRPGRDRPARRWPPARPPTAPRSPPTGWPTAAARSPSRRTATSRLVDRARGRGRRPRRRRPRGHRADRRRAGRRARPRLAGRPAATPWRSGSPRPTVPPPCSAPALPGVARPGHRPAHRARRATRWPSPPRWAGMADAVVVSGVAEAAAALAHLKDADGGRAGLLVTGGLPPVPRDGWPELPEGVRWALDVVDAPAELQPALARALERVAARAPTSTPPSRLVAHPPAGPRGHRRPATCVGADWAVGGQPNAPVGPGGAGPGRRGRAPSCTGAVGAGRRAGRRAGRGPRDRPRALGRRRRRRRPRGRPPTARRSAVAAELAELGAAARSAAAEAERHRAARVRAEQALRAGAAGARRRSSSGWPTPRRRRSRRSPPPRSATGCAPRSPPPGRPRPRHGSPSAPPRSAPVRCTAGPSRCAARPGRSAPPASAPRRPGSPGSAGAAVAARRACRRRAGARRARRRRSPARPPSGTRSPPPAPPRRPSCSRSAPGSGRATAELDRLTDEVHRDEVARAEQRYRIEALEARAAEEYGVDLPTLLGEYGPAAPVPPSPAAGGRRRGRGRARARAGALRPRRPGAPGRPAERDLATLGKVNPLALEEFAALEERHGFLATQLEDLKTHPARPAHRRPRGRRADPRGLRGGLRRRRSASSSRSSPPSSRAGTGGWSSPTPTTC